MEKHTLGDDDNGDDGDNGDNSDDGGGNSGVRAWACDVRVSARPGNKCPAIFFCSLLVLLGLLYSVTAAFFFGIFLFYFFIFLYFVRPFHFICRFFLYPLVFSSLSTWHPPEYRLQQPFPRRTEYNRHSHAEYLGAGQSSWRLYKTVLALLHCQDASVTSRLSCILIDCLLSVDTEPPLALSCPCPLHSPTESCSVERIRRRGISRPLVPLPPLLQPRARRICLESSFSQPGTVFPDTPL